MSERLTVSDSKAKFHKEFQYVIPAVYRRIVDEFIVELNLLRNQKKFSEDNLFSFGLVRTYLELTTGYKPKEHVKELFNAILISTGFDFERIESMAKNMIEKSKSLDKEDFKDKALDPEKINKLFLDNVGINKDNYYSRITGIGLFKFIEMVKGEDEMKEKSSTNIGLIGEAIGFRKDRIEKDISLYKNNAEKINKVMELIKINIEEEKRREDRREKIKKE